MAVRRRPFSGVEGAGRSGRASAQAWVWGRGSCGPCGKRGGRGRGPGLGQQWGLRAGQRCSSESRVVRLWGLPCTVCIGLTHSLPHPPRVTCPQVYRADSGPGGHCLVLGHTASRSLGAFVHSSWRATRPDVCCWLRRLRGTEPNRALEGERGVPLTRGVWHRVPLREPAAGGLGRVRALPWSLCHLGGG